MNIEANGLAVVGVAAIAYRRELYAIRPMRILKRAAAELLALGVVVRVARGLGHWPGAPEIPVARLATPDDRFVEVDGLRLRYRSWARRAKAARSCC